MGASGCVPARGRLKVDPGIVPQSGAPMATASEYGIPVSMFSGALGGRLPVSPAALR
jgi:hypothetical protein